MKVLGWIKHKFARLRRWVARDIIDDMLDFYDEQCIWLTEEIYRLEIERDTAEVQTSQEKNKLKRMEERFKTTKFQIRYNQPYYGFTTEQQQKEVEECIIRHLKHEVSNSIQFMIYNYITKNNLLKIEEHMRAGVKEFRVYLNFPFLENMDNYLVKKEDEREVYNAFHKT